MSNRTLRVCTLVITGVILAACGKKADDATVMDSAAMAPTTPSMSSSPMDTGMRMDNSSMMRDSMMRDSTMRDSMMRDSMKRNSMRRDSARKP